jgi:PPK2 family polyphosphate:nucleotide phosphotransferase
MFSAGPHRFLVPFDGSFRVARAPTKPSRSRQGSASWEKQLPAEAKRLADSQDCLYSLGKNAVLIVMQALDAAGKDGTIRHVFSQVNPNGLHVAPFRQPSALEASHDFIWRTTPYLPARGHLTVFNRSYYEEVLVVRVHPEFLRAQHMPDNPPRSFWAARCRAIVAHERHLAREGTMILKFWLNVSKQEQRKRLLERIDDADKHWKFRAGDIEERGRWDDYVKAYEDCLNATSRPWAPWYAVPADDKDFLRLQVAKIINSAFTQLDLKRPAVSADTLAALTAARTQLLSE